jgi:hypothetical protein
VEAGKAEGPEFLLTRLRDPNEEGGTLCSATGGRKFSDELVTALAKLFSGLSSPRDVRGWNAGLKKKT